MQRLAAHTGLSAAGHDFLIAALDPMHDNQLQNLQGWPDVESAPSVVRCFKQSVPITVPSGIIGNWDCLINSWPLLEDISANIWSRNIPPFQGNNIVGLITTPASPIVIGGVTAYGTTSGTDFNLGNAGVTNIAQISTDSFRLTDPGRVIGMGIEVVNTTSALNRQGTTTVFRVPQGHLSESTYNIGQTGGIVPVGPFDISGTQYVLPPVDTAAAMLFSGSRQWKAEDGSYQVVSFVGQDNPPKGGSYTMPLFLSQQDQVGITNNSQIIAPASTTSGSSIFPALRLTPQHMSGVFFTGLSNSTTLTLNVNLYYETFPNASISQLTTLAKPSALYDPIALEFLSRSLNVMPVGVQASMNWEGEWFANVVSTLADFAAPIGAALGGPAGAAIGGAFGLASKSLASYMAPAGVNMKDGGLTQKRVRATREVANAPQSGNFGRKTQAQKAKRVRKRKPGNQKITRASKGNTETRVARW